MPLIAVSLVSAGVIGLEVLLTRLYSIVQWHHFAYMIISIALLGFGASGTFLALARGWLLQRLVGVWQINAVAFGLVEAEQNVTRFEPCELSDILEEAVEMREWARTPHTVDVKLPETLPQIHGNRSALVRVVYSLLDNASKYSGPDEPITLGAHPRNGMVAIEVVDRGVGISPEDMPHVFERFYRGRTSDDVKGAGLGLSIAQLVVASHGGRIEVESKPGKGSRFKVVLPVAPRTG